MPGGLRLVLALEAEQCPGMPHLQAVLLQKRDNVLVQLHQPQQIGHRHPRATHGVGDLLMGQRELLLQSLQRSRLFQGMQILTLYVLDQGDRHGGAVRHLTHHARHLPQLCHLRRPPAALAGNDLVALITDRPHHDRLDHALGADRIGKLGQRLRIDVLARLIPPPTYLLHRQRAQGDRLPVVRLKRHRAR